MVNECLKSPAPRMPLKAPLHGARFCGNGLAKRYAPVPATAKKAFFSSVNRKSGTGSVHTERLDKSAPIISAVRLSESLLTIAVRCAVLLTVTVFFSYPTTSARIPRPAVCRYTGSAAWESRFVPTPRRAASPARNGLIPDDPPPPSAESVSFSRDS